MAGVIYATVIPPTPPPAPLWLRTRITWTGHDGSFWDITDPEGGACLLRDGVEGLHMPKFKDWVRESPAISGQRFAGSIAEARTVVLPLAIYTDVSSKQWVEHDSRFWNSMHPRKQGTLRVYAGGSGSSRRLRLRLTPELHRYDQDPSFADWAEYVAVLVADQPFWEGKVIERTWGGEAAVQKFYEDTGTHLINLMSGHTTSSATVWNEGDEDAWPVWTIIGPTLQSHVGVGTNLVQIPFEVADGKALVIDTDPTVRTAIQYDYSAGSYDIPETFTNPLDRTADLTGSVKFAAIPAGDDASINISLEPGTGYIRVKITPLYWRAW